MVRFESHFLFPFPFPFPFPQWEWRTAAAARGRRGACPCRMSVSPRSPRSSLDTTPGACPSAHVFCTSDGSVALIWNSCSFGAVMVMTQGGERALGEHLRWPWLRRQHACWRYVGISSVSSGGFGQFIYLLYSSCACASVGCRARGEYLLGRSFCWVPLQRLHRRRDWATPCVPAQCTAYDHWCCHKVTSCATWFVFHFHFH